MDLHIFWSDEASKFLPDKPTYAVRIFMSGLKEMPKLQESPHYLAIQEYTFDDNDGPLRAGPVSITPEIAESIVLDFAQYRDRVSALLVHCSKGINRSPAVAIALSETFELENDTESLKKIFTQRNQEVYRAITRAGLLCAAKKKWWR